MATRQTRLQSSLIRSQAFQETLDDFLDRLTKLEELVEKEKAVSGKVQLLKAQKERHDQVHNDVLQLASVWVHIDKTAEDTIESSEPGDEVNIDFPLLGYHPPSLLFRYHERLV